LLVVLYHADVVFDAGFIGVDAFFTISGFVITASFLRERSRGGTVSFSAFYARRIRRLLPAVALASTFTILASIVFAARDAVRAATLTGLAAAGFNANTYLSLFGTEGGYFGAGAEANPLLHLWSLSVEEQFYLFFPLALWLCWRLAANKSNDATTSAVITLVALLSLCLQIYLAHVYPGELGGPAAFYLAPARAWEFLAGALVALIRPRPGRSGTRRASGFSLLALGVLTAAAVWLDAPKVSPVVAPLFAVASTAALIRLGETPAGNRGSKLVDRLLRSRPLTFLGNNSYSWYLWHWPLIAFSQATFPLSRSAPLIAATASLIPAMASTRFVENRYRFRTSMSGRATIALGCICVVVPAVAGFAALAASPATQRMVEAAPFRNHLDVTSGCDRGTTEPDPNIFGCVLSTGDESVLLIGDSNAGQLSEAVKAAAEENGMGLRIAAASGCPFTTLRVQREGLERTWCRDFAKRATAWILANRPTIVIMASSSDLHLVATDDVGVADDAGGFTFDPAEKSAMYETDLEANLELMVAAGVKVVVVHPIPKFEASWQSTGWSSTRWSAARFWLGIDNLEITTDRSEALRLQRYGRDAEQRASKSAGAVTFDPFDALCPADPCAARRGTIWLYRDSAHLSVRGSEELAPYISDIIRRLL